MKEAMVHSSHGEFTINYDTGEVIDLKINTDDSESAEHLKSITKFDLNEYKQHYGQGLVGIDLDILLDESYDILDLGYWDKDENYYEPEMDWRKHIAKETN